MGDTLINLSNLELFKQGLEQEFNLDTDAMIKANKHIDDAGIHVTAEEKKTWNGKADLSDIPAIPASLPANGGNAETVGGKSVDDLIYPHGYYEGDLDELKSPWSGLCFCGEGRHTPRNVGWGTLLVYTGGTGSVVQVFANPNCNYIRHCDVSTWSDWEDISPKTLPANGGNADTVDGKHAADFAAAGHTHDDRYYTEAEVNNLLAGKAASSHSHTAAQISGLPTSLPANGGNANTANIATAVRTLNQAGTLHGDGWLMTAQYNRVADGLFRIFCGDGSIGTSVNYADNSGNSSAVAGIPVVTTAALGLHRLASGTAAATAANCPAGCWYGQHG